MNPGSDAWDLVVVGAGPAGAIAAHVVARTGARVLMLDRRSTSGNKFGEALPPAAVDLVMQLLGSGSRGSLRDSGLEGTRGNLACWASDVPELSDFFHSPAGHGLAIDRSRFDPALVSRAMQSGAQVRTGCTLSRCQRSTGRTRWRLRLGDSAEISARFVIDASGRTATIGRELNVKRQSLDSLFAYRRQFVSDRSDDDAFTRIEAAEQGWWYTQRIPSRDQASSTRMVVFHTDRDLAAAEVAARPAGFMDLLDATRQISGVLSDGGYRAVGKVRGACAASAALAQFAGDGWLAVGDAAQAYDPLSSQGITKALEQGVEAGHRVSHALQDSTRMRPLFKSYAIRRAQQWRNYRAQQRFFYLSQPRWPSSPFWKRRRQASPTDVVRSGESS